jgi:signal transduction histidine kinase
MGDPANISREFRSLVRSIRVPLEDELAERPGLPGPRRERLRTVHRDIMRLLHMVNDAFDSSQSDVLRRTRSELVDLGAKTVVLPTLRSEPAVNGKVPAGAPRILVVDDNEVNRTVARATLEAQGYAVLLATGGADALAVFDRDAPDCVLLDVQMPDLDGVEVCEQIRSRPGGADTPVMFLTAQRDVDTFDRALRVGANDFLSKPVRPAELVVRVQALLKLRQMRQDLREHYEILRKQRDDLMRLQLQKERLTAFVVHDLKNPVATVDLVAQMLLRHADLPPDARDLVAEMRSHVEQMNRMVMNLLDLAKADEGQLAPRCADLATRPLIDRTLSELALQAADRKLTLEARIDTEQIHGDDDLLRRMLANLVENAIHHAPPGTAITVTAAAAGGATELRVADRGHGVPDDMREKIFSPFVQVEGGSEAARRAGRGLGLAFCQVVARCHGGTIRVEDGAPGAVFCVRLPVAG